MDDVSLIFSMFTLILTYYLFMGKMGQWFLLLATGLAEIKMPLSS